MARPVRHLDDVQTTDLLNVYEVGTADISADDNAIRMRLKASLLAHLATHHRHPDLAHVDHPNPVAAAIGGFLLVCSADPETWTWAARLFKDLSLDAALLHSQARAVARPNTMPLYSRAVVFLEDPQDYELVPVADLPYGHSMHNCGHMDRFRSERSAVGCGNKFRRIIPGKTTADPDLEAGRRLQRLIDTGELQPCSNHSKYLDWEQAMVDAEAIRQTVRPWTFTAIREHLDPRDVEPMTDQNTLIYNLFSDPIRWPPGSVRVTGGQHRICGARNAGITHLLVGTG